jgi:LysM repeat protein
MPVGYAPVGPTRGERRAAGSRAGRVDPAAPSWEEPRRFEEYPTLKSRGGAGIPRPALYALVILLVGVGLFAAPFLLKGLGGGGEQASPTPRPSASVVASSAAPSPTAVPTPAQVVYTVKAGETLSQIAVRYGVTVDQIIAANPKIKNPNKIVAGDRIVIPQPLPSEIVDPGITPAP